MFKYCSKRPQSLNFNSPHSNTKQCPNCCLFCPRTLSLETPARRPATGSLSWPTPTTSCRSPARLTLQPPTADRHPWIQALWLPLTTRCRSLLLQTKKSRASSPTLCVSRTSKPRITTVLSIQAATRQCGDSQTTRSRMILHGISTRTEALWLQSATGPLLLST